MRVVSMLVLSGLTALIGCFALVANASAALGPLWGVCLEVSTGGENGDCTGSGSGFEARLLQVGSTVLMLALGLNTQVLEGSVARETIECRALHGHGDLEGGDPGTDLETLVYTECTVPHLAGCDVNSIGEPVGTITTKPLKSELVYLRKVAAENLEAEKTGTLFKPQNGVTLLELELKALAGGTCALIGRVTIEGNVLTENAVAAVRLLLHTIVAPRSPVVEYFVDEGAGNLAKKVNIARLKIGGKNLSYSGEISVKVSPLGSFGSSYLAFWVCP